MMNNTKPTSKRSESPCGKSLKGVYRSPVLQYFGAVTDLTNSAIGTCKDDSNTNICGADHTMAMF